MQEPSQQDSVALTVVGVIGDVHAEDEHLAQALAFLSARNTKTIWCVGDYADGQGDLERCCQLLQEAEVRCVAGNHDRWLLAGEMRTLRHAHQHIPEDVQAFLEQLPKTYLLNTIAGPAMLCHGVGDDDFTELYSHTKGYDLQNHPVRELWSRGDVEYMVAGHTHEPMVRAFPGLVVVNAGTLTRDHDPGFVEIDFEQRQVHFFVFTDEGVKLNRTEALPLPLPLV